MVILSLSVPNNIVRSFPGAKDLSPSRFLFVIVTPCSKYIKNNVQMNISKFNRSGL